jgi:hypothetical protein
MLPTMSDTTPTGSPESPDRTRQDATASVAEAAQAFGISHDAVRSRLRRGTLEGHKVGDEWRVTLPADRQPTGNVSPQQAATGSPTGNDLSPLVDHIAALEDQLQRLTEASTMWQVRARQAEEQLKALTAGATEPEPTTIASGSPRSDETPLSGIGAWWKRLRGGE